MYNVHLFSPHYLIILKLNDNLFCSARTTHTHTHFLSMQWFALISFEVAFHQDQPFLCSCLWLVSLQTRVSIILTGMLYVFDCKNSPVVFLFLKILCIRIGKKNLRVAHLLQTRCSEDCSQVRMCVSKPFLKLFILLFF